MVTVETFVGLKLSARFRLVRSRRRVCQVRSAAWIFAEKSELGGAAGAVIDLGSAVFDVIHV
jgi:hypothetical protein